MHDEIPRNTLVLLCNTAGRYEIPGTDYGRQRHTTKSTKRYSDTLTGSKHPTAATPSLELMMTV